MADLTGRYPIATSDGIAIPNDTIRPVSYASVVLSTTVSATITIPSPYETVVLFSSVDCIIRFGGTAYLPGDASQETETLFLPKNFVMTVSPTSKTLTAITRTGTGYLNVTTVASWAGLSLQIQNERG